MVNPSSTPSLRLTLSGRTFAGVVEADENIEDLILERSLSEDGSAGNTKLDYARKSGNRYEFQVDSPLKQDVFVRPR